MSLRVAIVGFRHAHIFGLHELLQNRPDVSVVAACEEDAATRAGLAEKGVAITHDSYARMLDEVDCDVVVCGDYFGIRGERLIAALERGKHVLGDKPLCTSLDELERMRDLAAKANLRIGCMLDLRDSPMLRTVRRLVREGVTGDLLSVYFNGQHPLLYGARPMWYFEEGKHGGTINDIGIHGIDAIPWLAGHPVAEIAAACAWNAKLPQHPEFQDGGVLTFRLANGCAVMGDVSYISPDSFGYDLPSYWRMTFTGTEAHVETGYNADRVTLYRNGARTAEELPLDPPRTGGYFDDFLADLAGRPHPDGLDTARVLESSRIALLAQQAADTGRFPVRVRVE
jgi:predicted dehydrogenase